MPQNNTGTYVALELDEQSRATLDRFVSEQLKLEKPVHPDYYHTTVIYSHAPVPPAYELDRNYTANATGLKYALFNTKQGTQCLTLLIESYQARHLNDHLTKHGATSEYPSYTPHLTLSYDFVGDHTALPLPDFNITYSGLLVKPLDTTFVPPSK